MMESWVADTWMGHGITFRQLEAMTSLLSSSTPTALLPGAGR